MCTAGVELFSHYLCMLVYYFMYVCMLLCMLDAFMHVYVCWCVGVCVYVYTYVLIYILYLFCTYGVFCYVMRGEGGTVVSVYSFCILYVLLFDDFLQ